jgi:hypothetical protein
VLETLTYSQIEALERASDVGNTKIHNTYRKLSARPISALQGLPYNILEYSVRDKSSNGSLTINKTGRTHNTYSKLRERTTAEHEGLHYHILEYGIRENLHNGKLNILKPLKNYKVDIILIKKYIVTLEVAKKYLNNTEV